MNPYVPHRTLSPQGSRYVFWPGVAFTKTITLRSVTLTSLLKSQGIDPAGYDALVMDTQGSELLVLKGADPILQNFKYIKTEVADFESYAGCCQITDIESFLKPRGYTEISRHDFASRPGVGHYYDIVYKRRRFANRRRPSMNP